MMMMMMMMMMMVTNLYTDCYEENQRKLVQSPKKVMSPKKSYPSLPSKFQISLNVPKKEMKMVKKTKMAIPWLRPTADKKA